MSFQIDKIVSLRNQLHSCAEASGKEVKTKAILKKFLQENTSLEILDCGDGFYAAHREAGEKEGIALRADYDALMLPNGSAVHLCGHDGHAAHLCGVALAIEGRKLGKNVFLIFQPAEEIGTGAKGCLPIFDMENIDEIYGAHNLPGFPLGKVMTNFGTFACGSKGMTLQFIGKPTHAAYPEHGISPAEAIARLIIESKEMERSDAFEDMVLCTVIGADIGEKAFGKAAEKGELWLTIRAKRQKDLDKLSGMICDKAAQLSKQYGLVYNISELDEFPATENHDECVHKIISKCGAKLLDSPMRWSEDFGEYLKHCKGAFFGIGAGVDHPHLHTEDYEYPNELLLPTIEAFLKIIE